jgi:DNA-binding transcriptional ArsR family regulator
MDEILALQAALATAQDTKSSIRLSERNIVELVNKLKSLDLLDDTLLYTLNGKEYLTEARLDAEIKREVKRSGGRVPVTDLQPALNVDVAHCERRARALAADASNGVALVEGELITPAYFDAVAAETDEELREAGVIGVGELARRHGLSADLMTKALRERVEAGAVDGRLEGGSVYTPGYVRRLRAQLRGAMRAALVPTTRDALVANALRREDRHGVADAALTGALLGDLARGSSGGSAGSAGKRGSSLRERGGRNEPADAENVAADGALRGGAWHPAVYSRAQAAAVGEVYARAGVVTAEQAKRMGVADPSSYFEAMDIKNRAVALGESFVAPRVVEQLDAAVRDALAENGGWCECGALVPPDLPPADAPALLAATDAVGGAGEKGAGERGGRRRVKTDAQSAAKKSAKKTRNTDDAASPETPFDEAPKKKGDEPDGRVVARLITHSTSRHAHHGALVACATPAFLERARALARELGAARGREEGTRRQLATAPGELAGAGAARRTEISSAEKPRTKTPSPEISPATGSPARTPRRPRLSCARTTWTRTTTRRGAGRGRRGRGRGRREAAVSLPRPRRETQRKNQPKTRRFRARPSPEPTRTQTPARRR